MAANVWTADLAGIYDNSVAHRFAPETLTPEVDFLAALAPGERYLEFAIGTGRVAIPLHERGIDIAGIELSPHMVDVLRSKPEASEIEVHIGDMATTRVPGVFGAVVLVFNTIMNLTTQDEQVAVFQNAACHLSVGGKFVVEVVVPQLAAVPSGGLGRIFDFRPNHVGIETFDDTIDQISTSHHWETSDSGFVHHSSPFRYVWPSELVLMARLAGLSLVERWSTWTKEPLASNNTTQIAVFEKLRGSPANSHFAM